MRTKNIRSLENLAFFCQLGGLGCIILGVAVIFMDILNRNYAAIQIGILIIAIGYDLVKISSKLNSILNEEKIDETRSSPTGTWS